MKKYIILCLLVSFSNFANGQDNAALQLLKENREATGLTAEQLKNSIIADTYYNSFAGTTMIYLQQSYLGLPVYNQLKVFAFKNGRLVSIAGEKFLNTNKTGYASNSIHASTPEDAIQAALAAKKIYVREHLIKNKIPGNRVKYDVGKLSVALENITAELMWVPVKEGELKLAWEVYFVPVNSSDYWLIRVDAQTKGILDESNLTVYCDFSGEHDASCNNFEYPVSKSELPLPLTGSNLVQTANYLVVPFPVESPGHAGGTPSLQTNPWTMAAGNATTLGWHNDGSTDYLITRGNNVYAQEDRDNNNNTFGLAAVSTTGPDPLNFNFAPNFTLTPLQTTPVENQQFNITNLFYWNNIIHDLTYLYGFDEAAGNFQKDNLARGGAGNDYVIADAQDGGGTNNANFATPSDGSRPRMQMYLWSGSPQKDGDVDNGIIVHEYGHGISNRLTGGPSNSSCLQNGEQMGEGWSDYYGLMYTQDWASSSLTTGFTTPRGIGTYVMNQLPTGTGIRSQRYCTNFAINNRVYAPSVSTSPHNRGEIWCATLWDMTWNIINQVGSINPNIFNPSAGGGNSIALKLVTEGMKLQPCSPGFISGRDAILQADQLLYGGLYSCAIKEAFRRRGMGAQASQGSSGSVTDQVPDFSEGATLQITQNGITEIPESQNLTYTNIIKSPCNAVTGHTLRDTLPLNVSYVSGGSYTASDRVVSFPVSQPAGATQNYSFTVNVNNGSYFAPVTLLDEKVLSPALPAEWTTASIPSSNPWIVSEVFSVSAPYSFYAENVVVAADQKLELVTPISLPSGTSPKLTFSHRFNTEDGWDGGVVEISINGGSSWIDLGPQMVSGGYNGTLGSAPTNALSNRSAFTGTTTAFIQTAVNLSDYAGQNIKIRFRFGSDDNTAAPSGIPGWFIDNILIKINPVINVRAGLYNPANVRVAVADTVTVIIPGSSCSGVSITSHPASITTCEGSNPTFAITATGTGILYQWQVSVNGGLGWSDIAGASNANYVLNNVTANMNGYRYRVVVTNACPSTLISNGAILTINNTAGITTHPQNISGCPGSTVSFNGNASGSSLTYQWQVSTDGGTLFINIPGAIDNVYTTPALSTSMHGNVYRLVVFGCGQGGVYSNPASLSVLPTLIINIQPSDVTSCVGSAASFTVAGSGAGISYQWQVSTNGGISYTDITGEINATLILNNISLAQNGFMYRVTLTSTCGSANSTGATLQVNIPVVISQQPADVTGCDGLRKSYSIATAGSVAAYQWQVSTNGGVYTNISNSALYAGVNSAVLQISAVSTSMNGNRYRVIITGSACGEVASAGGLLTVYMKPVGILQLQGAANLQPGVKSTISVSVNPAGNYTYQWYRNGMLLPNVTSGSLEINVDNTGDYKVDISDANGCTVSSDTIKTGFASSDYVFIYPNPNKGYFQVRLYSTPNDMKARTITIYDTKGTRVYRRTYPVTGSYEKMEVILNNVVAGIYVLELRDVGGKRLATGKILIQ